MKIAQKPQFVACMIAALFAAAPVAAQSPQGEATEEEAVPPGQMLVSAMMEGLGLENLLGLMADEARLNAGRGYEWMEAAELDSWIAGVARINDPARMARLMREDLAQAATLANPGLIAEALTFYRSDLGRRVIALENAARRQMLSEEGEVAAVRAVDEARARGDPRIDAILRLMAAGDVVERNVAGSLNASYATAKGYAEASGAPRPDAEMMREIAAQENEIRADVTEWVMALLYLGYQPLSDPELARVEAFVASDPGQEITELLSTAFDALFIRLAYETGMLSATQYFGTDL